MIGFAVKEFFVFFTFTPPAGVNNNSPGNTRGLAIALDVTPGD